MRAKLKYRGPAAYVAACTASCSFLAPPDSELMNSDRIADAAPLRAETSTDGVSEGTGEPVRDGGSDPTLDGGVSDSGTCAAMTCPANSMCREHMGKGACECSGGFIGLAGSCRLAISCDELHTAQPGLQSGNYTLLPLGSAAEIQAYCEMDAEGGGWTLILNQGPSFDPREEVQALIVQTDAGGRADAGKADAGRVDAGREDGGRVDTCFDKECVTQGYPSIRVRSDVMLDMSDDPISGDAYSARVIISGIGLAGRGKTLRELFTTGPYFLDSDDNSNVTVRVRSGTTCASSLPYEMGNLLCSSCRGDGGCGANVLVFGDSDSICAGVEPIHFAIGAAYSHTEPWGQCAGWPQEPNYGDYNFLPDNYRIWLR